MTPGLLMPALVGAGLAVLGVAILIAAVREYRRRQRVRAIAARVCAGDDVDRRREG